jgi:hypothetical protein
VPEQLHGHARGDALLEQQRRCCVPRVVQASRSYAGREEQVLRSYADVATG